MAQIVEGIRGERGSGAVDCRVRAVVAEKAPLSQQSKGKVLHFRVCGTADDGGAPAGAVGAVRYGRREDNHWRGSVWATVSSLRLSLRWEFFKRALGSSATSPTQTSMPAPSSWEIVRTWTA